MSATDELTIWMLSTARKAPSAAPTTASQVFVVTLLTVLSLAGRASTGVAKRGAAGTSGPRISMADMAAPLLARAVQRATAAPATALLASRLPVLLLLPPSSASTVALVSI